MLRYCSTMFQFLTDSPCHLAAKGAQAVSATGRVSIPDGQPLPFSLVRAAQVSPSLWMFQFLTDSPCHLASDMNQMAATRRYTFQFLTDSPCHLAIVGSTPIGPMYGFQFLTDSPCHLAILPDDT